MAASIISALAAVAAAVISAIAAVRVAKVNKEAEKQTAIMKEHNEWREKEAVLQGRMVSALCDLSDVTAIAVTGGHTNGNVEAARKKAETAKQEYNKFLKEVALKELQK